MPLDLTPAQQAVEAHVRAFFAGRAVDLFAFDDGPIEARVPGFAELCVAPADGGDLWTYVSCGVWDAVHQGELGIEFCLIAPERAHRHALHLAQSAFYHAKPDASQRLDLGHTVPIGEPWMPGSALDHDLVSLPYTLGPDFENCVWDGGHARILWLMPITESERDFKREHGLEALEQRFEEADVRYADPARPAVA